MGSEEILAVDAKPATGNVAVIYNPQLDTWRSVLFGDAFLDWKRVQWERLQQFDIQGLNFVLITNQNLVSKPEQNAGGLSIFEKWLKVHTRHKCHGFKKNTQIKK